MCRWVLIERMGQERGKEGKGRSTEERRGMGERWGGEGGRHDTAVAGTLAELREGAGHGRCTGGY